MPHASDRVPKGLPNQTLEGVSADDRRRVLEAMAFESDPRQGGLDPMILGSLGFAVLDPPGERFPVEGEVLANIATQSIAGWTFEVRVLVEAVVEVWANGREGTAASRVTLLRSIVTFVLHHLASCAVLAASSEEGAAHG